MSTEIAILLWFIGVAGVSFALGHMLSEITAPVYVPKGNGPWTTPKPLPETPRKAPPEQCKRCGDQYVFRDGAWSYKPQSTPYAGDDQYLHDCELYDQE